MARCGNTECKKSTGIHGGITCGHGRLDPEGYWEFPCRPCAEEWDENLPQLKEETKKLNSEGYNEWLTEAWPYKDTDIQKTTKDIQTRLVKDEQQWEEFAATFFPELVP